jgi:acetylornithine/succinyldiaminopimelate/putrescine aminotransferase
MGALVTTKEIAESIGRALYFNTFGGNPLATTAAKATLEVSFIHDIIFHILMNDFR